MLFFWLVFLKENIQKKRKLIGLGIHMLMIVACIFPRRARAVVPALRAQCSIASAGYLVFSAGYVICAAEHLVCSAECLVC